MEYIGITVEDQQVGCYQWPVENTVISIQKVLSIENSIMSLIPD